jgi:hypothetical protein
MQQFELGGNPCSAGHCNFRNSGDFQIPQMDLQGRLDSPRYQEFLKKQSSQSQRLHLAPHLNPAPWIGLARLQRRLLGKTQTQDTWK